MTLFARMEAYAYGAGDEGPQCCGEGGVSGTCQAQGLEGQTQGP